MAERPDPKPREFLRVARHQYTYEHQPAEAIAAALIGLLAAACEMVEAPQPAPRRRWWQR